MANPLENTDENTETKKALDTTKNVGALTSPEGILMLCAAALLDGVGLLFFIIGTWFGIDDYGILDIIGLIIFGGWMLLRLGNISSDAINKGAKRFLKSSVVEIVPFLGGLSPTWLWLVYKTLKEDEK